ncbi:hypothetical protein K2173_016927 [Erythroxylum novogranatense]|uniref:Uncharacterized protein n=1 Tax=Erythroxylum novogranatense TaxID=1862640 RepID=A0AAV8U6F1_9ROSI|nr:hypothetical protein K2173_016927 [Erythroxylum novogranatense]
MEFKWQSLPDELFPFICFFAIVGGVSLFGSENLRQGVIFFRIQSCRLLLTTVARFLLSGLGCGWSSLVFDLTVKTTTFLLFARTWYPWRENRIVEKKETVTPWTKIDSTKSGASRVSTDPLKFELVPATSHHFRMEDGVIHVYVDEHDHVNWKCSITCYHRLRFLEEGENQSFEESEDACLQGERQTIEESQNISIAKTISYKSKCKLFDWRGSNELLAEGHVSSNDSDALVHHVPIGPDTMRVWIDLAKVPIAFLWRPASEMIYVEDAVDCGSRGYYSWEGSTWNLKMIW